MPTFACNRYSSLVCNVRLAEVALAKNALRARPTRSPPNRETRVAYAKRQKIITIKQGSPLNISSPSPYVVYRLDFNRPNRQRLRFW
jgi:hypothetical protein